MTHDTIFFLTPAEFYASQKHPTGKFGTESYESKRVLPNNVYSLFESADFTGKSVFRLIIDSLAWTFLFKNWIRRMTTPNIENKW